MTRCRDFCETNREAVKIWNHIQVLMRGNRIIRTRRELEMRSGVDEWCSPATLRCQQVVEGIDLGIERRESPLVVLIANACRDGLTHCH